MLLRSNTLSLLSPTKRNRLLRRAVVALTILATVVISGCGSSAQQKAAIAATSAINLAKIKEGMDELDNSAMEPDALIAPVFPSSNTATDWRAPGTLSLILSVREELDTSEDAKRVSRTLIANGVTGWFLGIVTGDTVLGNKNAGPGSSVACDLAKGWVNGTPVSEGMRCIVVDKIEIKTGAPPWDVNWEKGGVERALAASDKLNSAFTEVLEKFGRSTPAELADLRKSCERGSSSAKTIHDSLQTINSLQTRLGKEKPGDADKKSALDALKTIGEAWKELADGALAFKKATEALPKVL